MPRRKSYDQACSVASALDRIGERWSLLIVRELLLGPLRFSDLARGVGSAPSDILTRRLRALEADGIVRRRELDPPAAGTVYELTELGRELEGPVMELGRWGLNFYRLEDLPGLVTSSLANALRVILRAPEEGDPIALQLHSEGHPTWLRAEPGATAAGRGEIGDPDLVLSGEAPDVIAALVVGGEAEERIEIEGDRAALERLRAMVVLPERLRDEALADAGATQPA
ncbi:MAG TPA: helix-turn-helix domain-containing protein [Solirubrobacterales bacterium]|nr:helix-turn-helix domain-containing protein [Solirubrobacterales bacterium]